MKKRKIIALFILMWFSLFNSNRIAAEKLLKSKILPIKTEVKSFEEKEKNKILITEKQKMIRKKTQSLIKELNQLKVYVLVTTTTENRNEDVLLSLTSEGRFDAENVLIDYRHRKLILTRTYATRRKTVSRKNRFSIIHIVRANLFLGVSNLYRNAKTYSTENAFGYKSICPLFFDKFTAENFLLKSLGRTKIILRNLPKESNKEIVNGFLNAKIKVIPLGDLFLYLTAQENEQTFEKFEFLFIPYLSKVNSLTIIEKRKVKKLIQKKSFSFYQQKFLEFQKDSENLEEV